MTLTAASLPSSNAAGVQLTGSRPLLSQQLGQPGEPTGYRGLHRADRHAEQRGRLGLAAVVVEAQHDGRALPVGQLQQRDLQPLVLADARVGPGRVRESVARTSGVDPAPDRSLAPATTDLVDNASAQVGADVVDATLLPLAVGPGEHLGHDVLGLVAVATEEAR